MNKKENDLRVGFHSIESILEHNPHKIKKITLPAKREDGRITKLIQKIEENKIPFEFSNKVKQEPEAYISSDLEMNFKDLKLFLDSDEAQNPFIYFKYYIYNQNTKQSLKVVNYFIICVKTL